MIQYLLAVTICWAMFLIAYKFIFQKVTFFQYNRIYLLGSFAGGLLIPFIAKMFYVSESVDIARSYVLPEILFTSGTAQVIEESTTLVNWSWLWIIYIIGALISLSKLMYGLAKIYSYFKGSEQIEYEHFTRVNTNKVHLPFSFFKYVFISSKLPRNEKIDQILKHETAHMNQWHSLDILFIELIQITLWFHPFVYFYKQAIKQSHEFYADAYATQDASKEDYSVLLAEQSPTALEINLCNQFFSSKIKKRLIMIQKTKTSKNFLMLYLLAIPLLGVMMLSFMKSDDTNHDQTEILEDSTQPMFPGCEDARPEENCSNTKLLNYVYSNLEYPRKAKESKIEGKAIAQFVVDTKGEIGSISIVRDIGGGTSEEIRRVLLSMNSMPYKWIPGKKDGKATNVKMTLPVIFKLADELTVVAHGKAQEKSWKQVTEELKQDQKLEQEVFAFVEQLPRFPGCEDLAKNTPEEEVETCHRKEMLKYVYTHVRYPKAAREKGIEGTSVVQYVINTDGKMEDITIIRGVHESIDKEVMRMAHVMNEEITWIPGMQSGKKVKVKYTLPVKFKIDSGDSSPDLSNLTQTPPPPPNPPAPPIPPIPSPEEMENMKFGDFNFKMSPNPSNSELRITTDDALDGTVTIKILNKMGQTMQSSEMKMGNKVLNIESLNPGTYVLVLESKGKRSAKSFVKM